MTLHRELSSLQGMYSCCSLSLNEVHISEEEDRMCYIIAGAGTKIENMCRRYHYNSCHVVAIVLSQLCVRAGNISKYAPLWEQVLKEHC